MHAQATTPRARRARYGVYIAIVLLLPFLSLAAMFPLAASPFFMHVSRRTMWHATEYRFLMGRQDCDVVIFGDSSGMIGVSPAVIEARTGWKTCNLGLPYMVTALSGTRVLDDYLARNKAPRFIVFHYGPGHLRPPALDETNGIIDGWLEVATHEPHSKALRLFLAHPEYDLDFAIEVWRQFFTPSKLVRPDFTGQTYARDMAGLAKNRGYFPRSGTAWEVVCDPQYGNLRFDAAYLRSLVERYSRGGTQAMVWVGPARSCDARNAQYKAGAEALGLRAPDVYPQTLFSDAYHVNMEGAERNSEALAEALLRAAHSEVAAR